MNHPRHLFGVALAALVLGTSALAHDDDPKLRDRQPPYRGAGVRTGLPIPGGQQNAGGGGMFPSSHTALLSWLTLDDFGGFSAANDCWGYVSPSGREYAIIGLSSATGFVDITSPNNPTILATHSGPSSTWRDIKVYNDRAYVVSEGGDGIQVFDLSSIDSGVVTFVGNVTTGGTQDTHNVAIDTTSGYLYRCGGGNNVGLRIYDLNANPDAPPFVGQWLTKYVHDAQVFTFTTGPNAGKEIAFCSSGFNNGGTNTGLTILDVTDKANIQVVREVFWPGGAYSHQCWLSDDQGYLFLNDELDEPPLPTTTYVIDVEPMNSAFVAASYTNGNDAIGHNGYVDGDLFYEANYRSGLRVMDVSDPLNIAEIGFFDTYPDNDAPEFNGLWSCYPYFPSGVVIGSDTIRGLFVIWPGDPLLTLDFPNGAPLFVDPAGQDHAVHLSEATPGDLVQGTEMLHYDIGNGFVSVPLVPQGNNDYLAQFPTASCGTPLSYFVSAESTNGLVWTDPPGGETAAHEGTYGFGFNTVFADDFENDQGWTAQNAGATSGDWERGVPVNDPNWPYDPMSDSDGSGQCFLTENAVGNTDVDGGSTQLSSPVMDLSVGNVRISYDYFLRINDSGSNDRILVEIDTGGANWISIAQHNENGGLDWTKHEITQADLDAAGVSLSPTSVLRFTINDGDPQSIVEGGLDAFVVETVDCLGCFAPAVYCTAKSALVCGTPAIGFAGQSSASASAGFEIFSNPALGKRMGVMLYGNTGPAATPFQGGFLCVDGQPVPLRTSAVDSGGTAGSCDGEFRIDLNAYAAGLLGGSPDPSLSQVGQVINVQWWGRDTVATGSHLSDAIEYGVCP